MDFTDYEIIEKYLNKALNAEEQKTFENELKTNKDFKEEFELYQEINKSLENKYTHLEKEKSLKNTLTNIEDKYFQKSTKKELKKTKTVSIQKNIIKFMSIAAVFAIGFFLLKPQTDLYTQFANHPTLEIQVKGKNIIHLSNAEYKFNNKLYKESIPFFKRYLKENNDSEIQLYLAIAQLETNELESAEIGFKEIYELNNALKNKATWYLALTYLKKNDKVQTKEFLNKIPTTSSYYANANKLLKKLK